MGAVNIDLMGMIMAYLLLIVPLGMILWMRLPIMGRVIIAIIRMTVQMLLVGLYLKFVFKLDNIWLNSLWIMVMIGVADVSIVRSCGLRVKIFAAV